MPHSRIRHLAGLFEKISAHSPLVGVLGHRQVGKTTFLSHVSQRYVTLDDPIALAQARLHPQEFVRDHAGSGGTAIDECQMAPELFSTLKEWVRTHRRPGQFFMSGSVRFLSRSAIRESLTGRILNIEVYPFGVAELLGLPLPSLVLELARKPDLRVLDHQLVSASNHRVRRKCIDHFLEAGGLPGVCFVRDAQGRARRIEEQLSTILDRDLRSVDSLRLPYRQLLDFVMELAKVEGEPINHSHLRARTGISPITQKKILYALEAVFIVRAHPIRGDSLRWTYLFEDQAEWRWLSRLSRVGRDSELQAWEGAVYRNLRLQSAYRLGEEVTLSTFATRSGVRVPLVIQTREGSLGIIPVLGEDISHKSLMSAHSFLRHAGQGSVIFVSKSARKSAVIEDRIGVLPASIALFE